MRVKKCVMGETTMKYAKKKKIVELENINEKEISMKKPEEKVVAEAKKHKVLKKALVSLALVSAIGACVFLTACNKKDNDKTTNGITPPTTQQGEQTGGNQGGQTGGNQGSQTGGEQTGGNQSEIEQGGQTGGQETGGETGGEVTPDPEKTPAEYKAECEEKIVEKVSEYLSSELTRGTISNVELIKLNAKDGKIYATADYTRGATAKYFYEMDSGLGDISGNTYKEISQKIDSSISLTGLKMDTILKSEITEEKYNDLCNYVLADVGLEGGTVLNATEFKTNSNGMTGTVLTVLYNGKIATVGAYCHSATTDNVVCIAKMLSSETNDIRITSYEDYKDFDYLNNEATMSAISYNLNLGGKTVATKTASGTFVNMNLSEDFCQ